MNTIISMLHSPTRTFETIRERGGGFTLPFILTLVIMALGMILQFPLIEKEILQQDLTTTGVEEGVLLAITKVFAVGGALFMSALTVFLGGLLLLLVNLIVRGEATYWQLVKVAVYAGIPGWINVLLSGLLARFSNAQNINELTISAAVLLEKKEGFLYGLMSMINPFSLWGLALMIIGTAVMARRASTSVAVWIIAGWVVIGLIGALAV